LKRFGIIAHTKKPNVARTAKVIIEWLKSHDLEYCLCDELAEVIDEKYHVKPLSEIWQNIDCALSLGGDGTMLSSIRAVGHQGVPVFGINVGRLGFLTEILAQDIPMALERLKNDDYDIEERTVLQLYIADCDVNKHYALNDVVLDHGESTHLIKLDLYCKDHSGNNQFVCSYNSDGLIISTPTGSTAYNLSAGGPVIHPHLGAIIANPICPHSLALRPIIFSDDSELIIKIAYNNIDARLTIDGQIKCQFSVESEIVIKKAPHKVKLIRIKGFSFFEVLRTKLHWGARPLTSDNA